MPRPVVPLSAWGALVVSGCCVVHRQVGNEESPEGCSQPPAVGRARARLRDRRRAARQSGVRGAEGADEPGVERAERQRAVEQGHDEPGRAVDPDRHQGRQEELPVHLGERAGRRHRQGAQPAGGGQDPRRVAGREPPAQRVVQHPLQRTADPRPRWPVHLHDQHGAGRCGRCPRRDGLRQEQGQGRHEGHPEDHLRRRRRLSGGDRGAAGDQGVPGRAREVPARGCQDPQGRPALRASRYRQDPAGPRRRR